MDFMMDCFGFAVLIVVAIVFFGVISSLRRRQRERMAEMFYRQQMAGMARAAPTGGACPRCNAVNAPEASFCRQCGLNIRQQSPPPPAQGRDDFRRASPALLYFIFAMLGLLGLAALLFSGSKKSPKSWDDDDDYRGRKSHRSYEH
jgi:hypothetical protein